MKRSETSATWAKAFDAAARMIGHQVKLESRVHGTGTRFWVSCDCGYVSSPGNSFRFAMSAGVGHISRVADALSPPEANQRRRAKGSSTVDIPQNAAGLT